MSTTTNRMGGDGRRDDHLADAAKRSRCNVRERATYVPVRGVLGHCSISPLDLDGPRRSTATMVQVGPTISLVAEFQRARLAHKSEVEKRCVKFPF